MELEKEKLVKAAEVLNRIANGINPLNGEAIAAESFLQDPRIIRCFFYVKDILSQIAAGHSPKNTARPEGYAITREELQRVELPEGKIGVNEFARCVNQALDLTRSKKITGADLNKRLKKMGILGEEATPAGKSRTVLTPESAAHGITAEMRNFRGNEYEMILFDDRGKQFLLDNLEALMTEDAAAS